MKTNKENTLISDWLETYGDKIIEKKFEKIILNIEIQHLIENSV
jgi:hypothetical protein